MSFYSSLILARAAPPPLVTSAAIGAFLREVAKTGALLGTEHPLYQVKYGPNVDVDERTTDVIDGDESGIIGTYSEYPWDVSETFSSVAALADSLAGDDRSVYRAYLSLGMLHPDIVAALTRKPCFENDDGLCLYDSSFSVGPVIVAGLASAALAFAGWMGLSLSGPGYFYPWSYREARERAEAIGLVQQLVKACRTAWPVEQTAVSPEAINRRRQLSELWLYDDFALLPDWLWIVSE